MTSGARVWAEEGCPMEKTEPAMVMVDRKRLAAMEAENPVQAATRYRLGNDLAECAERWFRSRQSLPPLPDELYVRQQEIRQEKEMSQPPFVMSKYASREDLLADAVQYYEAECLRLRAALAEITPAFSMCRMIMDSQEARDDAGEIVQRCRAALNG